MNYDQYIVFENKKTEEHFEIRRPVTLRFILLATARCRVSHFYLKVCIYRRNKLIETRQLRVPLLQNQIDTAYFLQTAHSNEISNLEFGDSITLSVHPEKGFEGEDFAPAVVTFQEVYHLPVHNDVAADNFTNTVNNERRLDVKSGLYFLFGGVVLTVFGLIALRRYNAA